MRQFAGMTPMVVRRAAGARAVAWGHRPSSQELAAAGVRLGLKKLRLSPHLARHGGISTDIFEGIMDLATAKKRGQSRITPFGGTKNMQGSSLY